MSDICGVALQDFDGQADGVTIWLQSRDAAALQQEAEKGGGRVTVKLDGKTCTLVADKHFRFPDQKLPNS